MAPTFGDGETSSSAASSASSSSACAVAAEVASAIEEHGTVPTFGDCETSSSAASSSGASSASSSSSCAPTPSPPPVRQPSPAAVPGTARPDDPPTFGDATGALCPSSATIAEAVRRELRRGDKAFSELPIHLKDISDLDLDAMDALPTATPGADANWFYAKSFVVDGRVYAAVVHMLPLVEASYVKGDIEKLIAGKRVAEVTDLSTVIGGVICFTRAEHLDTPGKAPRRRNLQWNKAVNSCVGKWALTINTHCPRHVIRAAVVPGTVAAQLDLRECFSAYRLAEDISLMNCFKYRGRVYRCLRMSMGQRTASMTASVGTLRIADVPLPPGCSTAVATDNLRIAGRREDVRLVLQQVIARAKAVGAAFNEDTTDIEALIMTRYEFLGEAYDHDCGSMQSTVKVHRKLIATTAALMEQLGAGTCDHRLLSVHLGVLFFVSSTLRVCIFDHFATMQFMRARAVAVQKDPSLWLKPLPPLTQRVRADLNAWTEHCLQNRAVPIAQPPGEATMVFMSDASAGYFAVICWNILDGTLKLLQQPWGDSFPPHMARDSTKAEPEAIYRSLCWALTAETAKTARVVFYTDHLSFVHSNSAGYGKCHYYNEVTARIAKSFPSLELELRHISGIRCIVDSWSRGASVHTFDEEKVMGELLEVAKDLTLKTKTGPFSRPYVAAEDGVVAAEGGAQ